MAKTLVLNIPNIPAGPADKISPEHWAWLKVQHPAEYAYAQSLIKAHEAEQAEAENAPKAPEGDTSKPSEKKGG